MDPALSSGAGSGNSGTYTPEMTETLRFEEEIQSLMHDNLMSPPASAVVCGSSSFTALLGLKPSQAVELLHELDPGPAPSFSAAVGFQLEDPKALRLPLGCSPVFPSNAALVERATRFSVFASEDSPDGSSAVPSYSGGDHSPKPKFELPDSESQPPLEKPQRAAKRKDVEKSSKAKAPAKKNKAAAGEDGGDSPANPDGEKLPYVHVRARRGQATDSHSLAERARREKINARMKLLQELVPGCSKISGTALVLDEIINHVQSLQRQVEFLSMRLAAVNPRIDFTGLDSILSAEWGRVTASGHGPSWNDHHDQEQQQIWHVDLLHPHHHQHQPAKTPTWESDDTAHLHHAFISSASGGSSPPGTSLFGYDSAASGIQSHSLQVPTLHSFFEVAQIITDEEDTQGQHRFLVRWKDKSLIGDTWMTKEDLEKLAPDYVEVYLNFNSLKKSSFGPMGIDVEYGPTTRSKAKNSPITRSQTKKRG